MARDTGPGFLARLGDILSDPWGEFLEALWARLWFGRAVFGAGLMIALYFGNWSIGGVFAALWALLEAIHAAWRWWRGQGRPAE